MSNSEQIQHMENHPPTIFNVWRSQRASWLQVGFEENIPLENFYHQACLPNQISTTYLISEKINKNLSGSGFKSKCECHTNCSDTSKNELEFNQQGITKNKI